jgi:chorismate mutase
MSRMPDIRGKVTKAVRGRGQGRAGAGSAATDGGPFGAIPGETESLPVVDRANGDVTPAGTPAEQQIIDLKRRRAQLGARVAELQFDLGGLVYEMAIRDRIRVDVLVKRAAQLQDADAELGEVERILRLEETSTAGACSNCGAPHSSGAAYCWQCGQPLLLQVPQHAIN